MTIQELRDKGLIIFETITGSRAYGTFKPESDTDYRGVFILPQDELYGLDYIDQVSDEKNDIVFYEIGRFLELLENNNPNILEILNMPDHLVVTKHPLFNLILEQKSKFITKQCKNSFAGYATTQIKKARGLNKKIVQTFEKERKSLIDFCWVPYDQGSIPLKDLIEKIRKNLSGSWDVKGYIPEWMFGCVAIDHMKEAYHLFFDKESYDNFSTNSDELIDDVIYARRLYNGIMDKDGVQIKLSSVEKGVIPDAMFYCNMEGFSKYCKDYKEYWDWVEKRNKERFETNAAHGKNYDSKNMMHCIRLLRMAKEIGLTGEIIVNRPDVSDLMTIRNGDREYEDVLGEADAAIEAINTIYATSSLPDEVDHKFVNDLLIKFRTAFYS